MASSGKEPELEGNNTMSQVAGHGKGLDSGDLEEKIDHVYKFKKNQQMWDCFWTNLWGLPASGKELAWKVFVYL